jgi:hypothetical protein
MAAAVVAGGVVAAASGNGSGNGPRRIGAAEKEAVGMRSWPPRQVAAHSKFCVI